MHPFLTMGGLVVKSVTWRRVPQAISMQARVNISGLFITHSWAQGITQVQDTTERVFTKCKRVRGVVNINHTVYTGESQPAELCGLAPDRRRRYTQVDITIAQRNSTALIDLHTFVVISLMYHPITVAPLILYIDI